MTLADLIAELPLCGPWELRGPQQMLRTANEHCDCPLSAVIRMNFPQVNVERVLKQRTENPIHVMARRLGLSSREGDIIADAADGLDAVSASSEGMDFAAVQELRSQMIKVCGLHGVAQ